MSHINSDDYYKVLNISRDANENDIKRSYRKLAMKYHPDKNKNDKKAEEKFKKIGEAYGVLSDKEQKEQYDNYGKEGLQGGPQINPNDIFQSFFGGSNHHSTSMNGEIPDIFSNMMGGSTFHFQSSSLNNNPFSNQNIFGHQQSFGNQNIFGHQQSFGNQNPFNRTSATYVISDGEKVILRDIKSRQDLNGKRGYIEDYDNRKQRYLINVENEKLLLKQDNILCITNITHCQTKYRGKIINYNNNRYTLLLKAKTKSVKVNNVNIYEFIINDVAVVKLVNIKSQPYLNGEYVKIEEYDEKTERYLVKQTNGQNLKVKSKNIWI